jgi:hypothetical protein
MALTAASISLNTSFSESQAESTPFAVTLFIILFPRVFFLSKDIVSHTS